VAESGLLAGVAEVHRIGDGPPGLLIEVPHGATLRSHYDAVASRLSSPLPARLEKFFFVNTDFGAPEIALRAAELAATATRKARTRGVVVVRALVPRTFVDLNREVGDEAASGMTPGLPPYIVDARDREWLSSLHRRYVADVSSLYESVLGSGGLAVALHTYAPRSVDVAVDAEIVPALEAAYRPRAWSSWPERPPVDLITRDAAGTDLSPRAVVEEMKRRFAGLGVDVAENATYHLHPATMGYRFAARWPGRVLCVEFRRDLLGVPWRPFRESMAGPRKVVRFAGPLAEALAEAL
jgi:hypothetical protein